MDKCIDIIIQARTGSTRLPNKVMKLLEDKIVLHHVIHRVRQSKFARNVIVCTTDKSDDDIICNFCKTHNIRYFRGSEMNVLERYFKTAEYFNSKYIVRVTSDCPLIDHVYIDMMIEKYFELQLEYLGPKFYGNRKFPDGFNGEIFSYGKLQEANKNANEFEREHVTTYIINKYKTVEFNYPIAYNNFDNILFSQLHLSLDTQDDYILLQDIFKNVYLKKKHFGIVDVLNYLNTNPLKVR